jgi:hypothetical protein
MATLLTCLLVIGGIVVAVGSVFGMIASSEPYRLSLERARANRAVVEKLGEPIAEGSFPSGSIQIDGAESGKADLTIPVSGPRGSGTIYAAARKAAGAWEFTTLVVAVAGEQETIDLLGPEEARTASATDSAATVESLTLARDDGSGDAGEEVNGFRPFDRKMHFVARLSVPRPGTRIEVVLTAVDAGGARNLRLGTVALETKQRENRADVHFERSRDWAVGRYKVEAYVNGQLARSVDFDVAL